MHINLEKVKGPRQKNDMVQVNEKCLGGQELIIIT